MNLILNEQAKLTANFLNALASGVIIAGFVVPLIAVSVGFQTMPVVAWKSIASSSLGFQPA